MTHLFPSNHAPSRGPWVAEQVDALREYVDVDVLCCTPGADEAPVVRASGAHVTYVDTSTVLGQGRIGLAATTIVYEWALRRHLRQHTGVYDIVHAHFGFPDAWAASRVCVSLGLPLVVTLHGDDALRVMPRRDIIGLAVRSGVARASAVICVSHAMAAVVRPLLPNSQVRVIHNGVNASLFHPADVPRDLGVVFVGLLVPWKNVDLLIRAYASVIEELDSPLTIVGDGPMRPELEALARALGIAASVQFRGYLRREEVAGLMQRARVLALPSSSEGYPMVSVEALACGTPVVASSVGGLPEIITLPQFGTLLPSGDVDSLAQALVDWATGTTEHKAVAAAPSVQSWTERVRPISALYAGLIGQLGRDDSESGNDL